MIAAYPEFSPLTLAHKHQITQFTAQFEPYSDFNFSSLFCWNVDGSTEVSRLNGNLVIRMPDYLDGHMVYSILGTNQIDESVEILLEITGKLEVVPEVVIHSLKGKERFKITEDPPNHDYVYDLSHLSEFPGAHYKKKRNKKNVFIEEHKNFELEVKVVRQFDPEHAKLIKNVDRHWATEYKREAGDILAERKALDNMLDHWGEFESIMTEVIVEGEIKAFSINQILNHNFAICHFEKALIVHHENLNTFLVAEVAQQLRDAGCLYVNWEQDLGLAGLRKSKQSYRPIRMLKKYTIAPL